MQLFQLSFLIQNKIEMLQHGICHSYARTLVAFLTGGLPSTRGTALDQGHAAPGQIS